MTTTDFKGALASGVKKIGALVYWRGLSGVRIERDALREGLELAGLGEALGRDPKPETCLNLAAGTASRRQNRGEAVARVELKAKHTNAVYAVLMRRDIGARVQYLEEARISIVRDQPTPTPVVSTESDAPADDARDAVVQAVLDGYQDAMVNALTQEVSEAMVNAMELVGALPLRTGVYFVPDVRLGAVRALKDFLATHGVGLTMWDIAATDENAAEARQDARQAFLDRVRELREECDAFAAQAQGDLPLKSVNARVRRFKELDAQVAMYAEILGDFRDEMLRSVRDARDAFLVQVHGEQAAA